MKIYKFTREAGKKIKKFDSNFVMTRILNTDSKVHIGCVQLEANGVIGYHQAVVPQILLVVEGEGKVRGREEIVVQVKRGDAIYWGQDEWHELKLNLNLVWSRL